MPSSLRTANLYYSFHSLTFIIHLRLEYFRSATAVALVSHSIFLVFPILFLLKYLIRKPLTFSFFVDHAIESTRIIWFYIMISCIIKSIWKTKLLILLIILSILWCLIITLFIGRIIFWQHSQAKCDKLYALMSSILIVIFTHSPILKKNKWFIKMEFMRVYC